MMFTFDFLCSLCVCVCLLRFIQFHKRSVSHDIIGNDIIYIELEAIVHKGKTMTRKSKKSNDDML